MDTVDIAKELELKQRDEALKTHFSNQAKETPLIIDGVRVCLDCDAAIPEERIQANPAAVRCTECQSYQEQ